jgi:ABC-2 type transport system permease protein
MLPEESVIKTVLTIHKVRYRIINNWIQRFNTENWFSFFIMLGLLWFFWVGGFYFFSFLAHQFHKIPTVGDILIQRIMAFLFLALFLMTSFSDLITALSTLYLSKDLPTLHYHPVSPGSIFLEKFMQTVYYGAWAVVCFGIPIYFAYGSTFDAPWYFYPLAILSNIPFLIISAGLAILATLALAYFLPANKARTMVVILYGLSFVAVVIYVRMLGGSNMLGNQEFGQSVEKFLFNLTLTTNPYLPNYWINQVYLSAINRNLPDMFFYLALLFTTAALITQVSWQLAGRIYYPGWTKTCESVKGMVAHRRGVWDRIFSLLFRFQSAPVRSILIKDIKIFWRDMTQWGQFTLLITLVLVYLYNTRHVIENTGLMKQMVFSLPLKCLIGIFNLSLVGFVLANLAMRFVFTMISLEGRIIWVIKSSPFSMDRLFWVKYVLALVTMLLVGTGLILLANHFLQMEPFIGVISLLSVIILCIGLTSLATGLGAMFPTFNVENPMQLTTGTGAVITVVSGLLYLLASIVLTAQPMIAYFFSGGRISGISPQALIIPLLLYLAMNLLVIILPIWIGIRRLKSRE